LVETVKSLSLSSKRVTKALPAHLIRVATQSLYLAKLEYSNNCVGFRSH